MFRRKDPQQVLVPVERTRTEYVTKTVNVHEHRAPTDDSVKLLREMEQKAEAEVIKAVQVGNTAFDCVVHVALDNLSNRFVWRAIFKLNGKQMTATVETDARHDLRDLESAKDTFAKLSAEMAKG